MRLSRRALALGGAVLATPALAEIRGEVVIGRDGWLFAAWENIRAGNIAGVRRVGGLISEAIGILKQGGIEVGIVLVPMRARIYPEFLPETFRMGAEAEQRYSTLLADWRRAGALMPDLATAFTALKTREREPIFFKQDNHWRPPAAYLAAEEMARSAQAARLPPSSRPGTRLGDWVNFTQQTADLTALLPPADRARFPMERYRIRAVPPAVGSLLGDDDAGSDVALAGNSFTMPRMGFTPALSSALGRTVRLFMRAGNFGHWKMLTEYLSGPIFRNTRPRLLIWQLLEGNMEHMPDQRGYFGANAMAPAEFLRVVRQAAAR